MIRELSEDLLAHYADKQLIDQYDVYQHLMNYWAEIMQDDCYLICGWLESCHLQGYRIKKNKNGETVKEIDKGWACDLVPKPLIVSRFFSSEQEKINRLESELETVSAQMTEMEEENGGEEGVFSDFDKINKASVSGKLRGWRVGC